MGPTREVTQHTENTPPVGSPEEGPGWLEAEAPPTSMLDELPTGRTSGGPESSTNLGQAEQPEVDRAGAAMTPASPSTASTALTPHPPQPGPSPVRGGDGSPDNRHGAREALQPSTARDPGGPVESDGELSTTPPPRPGGIPDTPLAATTASPQGATPSSNTNEQGERGAGTDPGHNGSDFRPTGTVPRTGPHGDAITGANPASPVGGSGPSSHDRAQSPTGPATTEAANEAPVCGICLGDASEPSVRLPACGHVMCMGCYARASVREVGRVLHCPMCRVGSAIFAMTDALRQQHGDDIVSEAMLVAQSERDLVSATALEASQTQEPRHFCDVCQGLIGRGASTSAPCGCHFHTRCAIGLVEDHLPNALASGHDIISCPYQDQRLGHRFRASTVLPESGNVDVYDSEADRRSLTARIETIHTMLRDLGPGAIRPSPAGRARERPASPPSIEYVHTRSPTPSPDQTRPASPTPSSPRGTRDGICVACHESGAQQRPLITVPCSCLVHLTCALDIVETHLVSSMESSGSRTVACPNPAMHDQRRHIHWPRIIELVETAIPVWHSGGERESLQARVASAQQQLREMDAANGARNPNLDTSPRQVTTRNGAESAGPCSYCGVNFGAGPHAEGFAPTLVPCGHRGWYTPTVCGTVLIR